MIILFSLIAFGLVVKFLKEVKKFAKKVKGDAITDCVIELYGVKLDSVTEDVHNEMKEMLQKKYGEAVSEVIVIPNLTEAYKHFVKIEEFGYKLQHYEAANAAKGKQLQVATKCLCCKKVDAIDWFTKKREESI
jgi:hypothetical protein